MSDTCRGCHAPILWVTTTAGHPMPVDAAVTTSEDPRTVLYGEDGQRIAAPPRTPRTGHVPHWASCPVREQFWRQRSQRSRPAPP